MYGAPEFRLAGVAGVFGEVFFNIGDGFFYIGDTCGGTLDGDFWESDIFREGGSVFIVIGQFAADGLTIFHQDLEPFALPFVETRLEKGFFAGFNCGVIGGEFFVSCHEIEGLQGGLLGDNTKEFFQFVINSFVICDAFEGFESGEEPRWVFGELLVVFINNFGRCVLFKVVLIVFHGCAMEDQLFFIKAHLYFALAKEEGVLQ